MLLSGSVTDPSGKCNGNRKASDIIILCNQSFLLSHFLIFINQIFLKPSASFFFPLFFFSFCDRLSNVSCSAKAIRHEL